MDMYEFLKQAYGYNEPIFTDELKKKVDMNANTFRQTIKRLADKKLIVKVANGIYFIPSPHSLLQNPVLSVDKIVSKKFIEREEKIIGYKTGTNFANSLGLTDQTASFATVITNNTSSAKRELTFYNKKVVVKRPRVPVSNDNYKWLQVLDLFNEFDRLSEMSIEHAKMIVLDYVKDVRLSENELKTYMRVYPAKAQLKVYESGVYDELTRKQRSV